MDINVKRPGPNMEGIIENRSIQKTSEQSPNGFKIVFLLLFSLLKRSTRNTLFIDLIMSLKSTFRFESEKTQQQMANAFRPVNIAWRQVISKPSSAPKVVSSLNFMLK